VSSAELASANIVGYQANTVPSGWSIITPCFVNVDGTEYKIDDFLLNGVDDTMATVQVMNPDGSWGANGVWFNAYEDLPAGWFTDATGLTPADITLASGQSVMFSTTASGAKIVLPSALK
jgi:hypothetical protein